MRRFRHFFGLKTAALFIALAGLSFIQIAPVTAAGRCFCYGAGNEKSGCGPQTEATCKKDDDSVRGYKFEACLIQTDNAACEKQFIAPDRRIEERLPEILFQPGLGMLDPQDPADDSPAPGFQSRGAGVEQFPKGENRVQFIQSVQR